MINLLQSRQFKLGIGIVLIVAGLVYAIDSARGALRAYRAMEFAAQHNFDGGPPDITLIEGWMNIRYIAVAYTVPQSFLFEQINIPMERANSQLPLGRLNRRFELGETDEGPALIGRVQAAILKYQANPVVTGLTEGRIRQWMNVQYIANSTGISAETIFAQLGIPMEGHAYMPLGRLIDETGYELGSETLIEIIQQTVDAQEVTP